MLGAIAGDVIGSVFERRPIKGKKFPLLTRQNCFTDDTVLTVAVAYCLLHGADYAATFRRFGRKYPRAGYGAAFYQWLLATDAGPYNSFGNGSAMRVSPVGFARQSVTDVLAEAQKSAAVTHNHPEGIKGAQATALAVFLARTGAGKEAIRQEITARFGYALDRTLDEIRPDYRFDVTCQGSVPEAILAFLESTSYEDAVRNAISLGGDSDTIACMAGGMAEAFYGRLPADLAADVRARLPQEFCDIVEAFQRRFPRCP